VRGVGGAPRFSDAVFREVPDTAETYYVFLLIILVVDVVVVIVIALVPIDRRLP
jgi:hypothetical protein